MENEQNTVKGSSKRSPEELFNKFIEAEDCPEILQSFQRLVHATGVKAETPREFYQNLRSKLQSWKCKSLWELLDKRANQKEYSKGTICEDVHAFVIGCGPIGLRTAIELSLLGAQVVVVEKRQTFSRNNVLHLWPFLLTDFRSLGAKKFYGKFCSGSIDHISIRRLQSILLKTALIFGVKVFTGVTFEKVIEPISEEEGWKCSVTPSNHFVSDFEVDVLIGADGKKNVLPGFAQIEMRGTLAIGVTANFVNYYSEEEARVEEISGIAYQFNPGFFQKLRQLKGISLENIVYYKDETHYFVMTAVKSSLLERGVLKQDFGNNPQKLLSPDNVDRASLISYVNDTVDYATKGRLKHRDLKKDKKGNADIAVFDFTSIKKAENSARIKERKGHKLLIGLVGDSLLEPFWPTGSGCARGVLSALDAAWMVRSFALDKPPLQILSERENIYRLLSGTSSQNLQKNFDLYTINPSSRYMHIPQKKIQEVYHLFDTDDPVNADFTLVSPAGILSTTKGSKKKRVSLGTKPQRRPNRRHIKFAPQASQDSQAFSPTSSSTEDLSAMNNEDRVRFAEPKPRPRTTSENLTSGGEEVHEITKERKWGKKSRKSRSPLSSSQENQSKMKKSPFDAGLKKKGKRRKSDRASPPSGSAHDEKPNKRRSFFGFGRGKNKPRGGRKTPEVPKESKAVNKTIAAEKAQRVESSNGFTPLGEPAWNKDTAKSPGISRNHPTRRSARDIIAEMESRSKISSGNTTAREKNNSVEIPRRKIVELPKPVHEEITRKPSVKRTTSELDIRTPQSKHPKKEGLWEELSSISPSAKGAVPALSKMSPEKQQENNGHESHDIASAMRMAGLTAMATPLLLDEPTSNSVLFSERTWFSRNNGHVKSAINKYDSLTGKTLLAKTGKDISPLRAQFDMVDGPSKHIENRPSLVEIAKKLASNQRITSDEEQHVDQSSWQPTAIAFVEGRTGMDEMESAANERAMNQARQEQEEKLRLLKEDFSSLDKESTDSPVKKDFSSPIYKKTFIASVNETPKSKDKVRNSENEHKQLETPRDYAKEAEWRKSPALAKKEMERLMVALTETMSKERAEASIRFLISMFRRIQRNPKEDKYRRIFKSRVKFKKYVWTVRNAKMFMFASGWIEVGSFLLFSANKNLREPLAILNKHLGLLTTGASVQISTIKSTPKRDLSDSRTPRSARALPFSIPSTPSTPRTPKTNKHNTVCKTGLTASLHKSSIRNKEETPTRTIKHTSVDKRFSKSVPLNLDSEWDLEMEHPLLEESLSQSAVKRGRLASSALDVGGNKTSSGTITPLSMTPTRMPATPDVAVMEEIEGLSNTLDDLLESMEEDPIEGYDSKTDTKKKSPVVHEIKDLCTTLDYMLDSSEEEELDRDLNHWKTREGIVSDVASSATSTSAFSKVHLQSPSSKTISTSETFETKDEISALLDNNLSSVEMSAINVQDSKKDSLERSDKKKDDVRKTDVSAPVSNSITNDLTFNIQEKKKISLENKKKKSDGTSKKIDAASKGTDNVNAEEREQYSLRPRKTNSKPASNKYNGDAKNLNDSKKPSRRKLPNDPDKTRRPRSVSDAQIQKIAPPSLKSASNPPKKERPSSRNSVNSEKEAQESKTDIQRKVSDDNVVSNNGNGKVRKDKPFAISKVKSKSTATLSDNTIEAKRKSSANRVSNTSNLSSTSKSKSEMNISGKLNNSTSSKTHDKQKSSSVLNRKQSSSSETMSTTQEVEKIRKMPRNSRQHSEGNKKVELDATSEFKKPSVPKSRSRRPVTSKTAGKPQESTSEESLSTSSLDTSLKSRPPSGLERTRSARARKRKDIASKLDSLEISYETLEKSPNRTLNKKTSTSSIESNTSSLTKKESLTETVREQQRYSSRNKTTVSRTSSAASRSSATSGEDIPGSSRTRRLMSNDSSMTTRRRSSAKRTPSNASLERKKMDGLLTKEEQEVLRKRSKSSSEKPSTSATKDNQEKVRSLRSKAVDISQLRRADSSGSESIRRSGSFKAKHRRAATRSSSKSQDDTQATNSSHLEHNSKASCKKLPGFNVQKNVRSADDSFDDIPVLAKDGEDSVADGPTDAGVESAAGKDDRYQNENLPFSLRRKLSADGKNMGFDTTDFISTNIEHDEHAKTSTPTNCEQYGTKDIEKKVNESRDVQEESDCISLTDDTKMEFRLHNTGSWMVLDYKGLKESPRASISSIESLKKNTAEKMNDDDIRMEGNATEDEDESTLTHDEENGDLVSAREDELESLACNGSALEKGNGFVPVHEESDEHAQNGGVKPYSNGKASNGQISHSHPPRKEAIKKKVKDMNEKVKPRKMKSQSVENLTSDKSRVTFEEIQNLNVPRASTLDRSPKDAKKQVTFPFGLRKKKISGSCSDLNGRAPEITVESPTKTMTGGKPNGLIMSPDDKSFSSPHDKSYEKKKLAPFKMFKKRKSKDAST